MWYDFDGKDADIVISTRIRLARNLADKPFPGRLNQEDAEEIIEKTKVKKNKKKRGIVL